MATSTITTQPFNVRFIEADGKVLLELMNTTDQTLKCVEIMTIFLKDEETPGDTPSRAHIKFEDIGSVQPRQTVVVSHRTLIDGKPAAPLQDRLGRLTIVPGGTKSYVLDISWEDVHGKSRFQRIPVGH